LDQTNSDSAILYFQEGDRNARVGNVGDNGETDCGRRKPKTVAKAASVETNSRGGWVGDSGTATRKLSGRKEHLVLSTSYFKGENQARFFAICTLTSLGENDANNRCRRRNEGAEGTVCVEGVDFLFETIFKAFVFRVDPAPEIHVSHH